MDLHITGGGVPLKGNICLPGDKSISHRAALIGAIAQGRTYAHNFAPGSDCLGTLHCLRELGVLIKGPDKKGRVQIYGKGLRGFKEPVGCLDAGNSGTTVRLLAGILAGQDLYAVITGDDSLRKRPMERIVTPLKQMGALIDGRSAGCLLPISVRGIRALAGIDYTLPVPSAQVKSAILLAGLLAKGPTIVRETLKSRDHTERMLKYFGADIKTISDASGLDKTEISGNKELQAREITIPGDISSASFLIIGASIIPESKVVLRNVGINPTRTGILDALKKMGASVKVFNEREHIGEPVADICVESATLHGLTIEGGIVPRIIDELPAIAVAAAFAKGTTVIKDAAELRAKETDRIHAVTHELKKFGVDIEERTDGLIIKGGNPLKGTICDSWGDHRMAMSLAVAGLGGTGETIVRGFECVNVSWPDFADVLKTLGEE